MGRFFIALCFVACSSQDDAGAPDAGTGGDGLGDAALAVDDVESGHDISIEEVDGGPEDSFEPVPVIGSFKCDQTSCSFPTHYCSDNGFGCFFESGADRRACEARNHGKCHEYPPECVAWSDDGSAVQDCDCLNEYSDTCRQVKASCSGCLAVYLSPTDG